MNIYLATATKTTTPTSNNLLSVSVAFQLTWYELPEATNLENSFSRVFNEVVTMFAILLCFKRF